MSTDNNTGPLVLIVEDEGPIAAALSDIVEDAGYQVMIAQDGQKGLELALQRHPALIITDLMMPRLSGATLIRAVRTSATEQGVQPPPIILATAIRILPGIATVEGVTPDAILSKPFDLVQVESLLKQFLGQ